MRSLRPLTVASSRITLSMNRKMGSLISKGLCIFGSWSQCALEKASRLSTNLTLVGTSRCDVSARATAGGIVPLLNAAVTAQRDVPTRFGGSWREFFWEILSLSCALLTVEAAPPAGYHDNLRPCDTLVNISRGNKYYDVSDLADRNYNAVAHTNAPLCSTDTDSWEPPDRMKGDMARAIFYMDVRYAGEYPSQPDLVLTDDVASITSNNSRMGRLKD
jgi:hypothetical protein